MNIREIMSQAALPALETMLSSLILALGVPPSSPAAFAPIEVGIFTEDGKVRHQDSQTVLTSPAARHDYSSRVGKALFNVALDLKHILTAEGIPTMLWRLGMTSKNLDLHFDYFDSDHLNSQGGPIEANEDENAPEKTYALKVIDQKTLQYAKILHVFLSAICDEKLREQIDVNLSGLSLRVATNAITYSAKMRDTLDDRIKRYRQLLLAAEEKKNSATLLLKPFDTAFRFFEEAKKDFPNLNRTPTAEEKLLLIRKMQSVLVDVPNIAHQFNQTLASLQKQVTLMENDLTPNKEQESKQREEHELPDSFFAQEIIEHHKNILTILNRYQIDFERTIATQEAVADSLNKKKLEIEERQNADAPRNNLGKEKLAKIKIDLEAAVANQSYRQKKTSELKSVESQLYLFSFIEYTQEQKFELPLAQADFSLLMNHLEFDILQQSDYTILCQSAFLKPALHLERANRLKGLVKIIQERCAKVAQDDLLAKQQTCKTTMLALSNNQSNISELQEDYKQSLHTEQQTYKHKLESRLKRIETLASELTQLYDVVYPYEDTIKWPTTEADAQIFRRRIDNTSAALQNEIERQQTGQAKLDEMQRSLVSLSELDKEYAEDCELHSMREYESWSQRRQAAAATIHEHSAQLCTVEQIIVKPLKIALEADQKLLTDYEHRTGLLKEFENKISAYQETREANYFFFDNLQSFFKNPDHTDLKQREKYLDRLLKELKRYAEGQIDHPEYIRFEVKWVLNNDAKFPTSKTGEARKESLRYLLEALDAALPAKTKLPAIESLPEPMLIH